MLKIDGHDVQSKDFTGAADMFLGAFMHMFDEDKNNINESPTFANLCASKIIQVYGANLMISLNIKH